MTEREFIAEMEALGFEPGEAACRAALAAALGLPYQDALCVERNNIRKKEREQHDTETV